MVGLYSLSLVIGSASESNLIAAGPLSKQPATMPYRIVLVDRGSEENHDYVVYREYFDEEQLQDVIENPVVSSHFADGTYCGNDLVRAVGLFGEKVAFHAKYLESLNRKG